MELVEEKQGMKDIRDAAQLVLDQAILQTNGSSVFVELWASHEGSRVYVTDDKARVDTVIHVIKRNNKTYFLGTKKIAVQSQEAPHL